MTAQIARLAEPYAEALLDLAQGQNQLATIEQELAQIKQLLHSAPELAQVLQQPTISLEQKKNVLRQVLAGQVQPLVLNFLLLLVDRGRIVLLERIITSFQDMARQLRGTQLARVRSAVALTPEQAQQLTERLTHLSGARQVELETAVDASLLGGFTVQLGSQFLDTSLRSQLQRLALRLSQSVV
ncbi:F0F1 ATP synthase subunit delta [Gloeomargarita lithophora Alchichica-D10]|uniref:ATP synthase subunit delta n=1 Tax=Gloeomargarita lithophora Alchichica-D10 TaxID=1188229 RepID=A0A1J0ABE5_9CYAN|nr:ATP synthase F1 subunit delta [Gloeomargarita lithophora]APB33237.1 F0F1 ATP synthase subunit delta [Gloeomargarita lithophora Alchichica-D10]